MKQTNLKLLTLCAFFAALIAILSQIQIPLHPIVFNLAVLGVFMAGIMLPPLYALASIASYILLGVIGVPVFAGFMAGPSALLGATGGYIWGYLLLALLTSLGARYGKNITAKAFFMCIGLALCYTLGTVWFMHLSGMSLSAALAACVIPFIVPDILKGALAYSLCAMLSKRLAKAQTP